MLYCIQLLNVTSVEEMRKILDSDEYDMRYDIGIGQSSSSLELSDLDRIVQAFATHFSVVYVKAELDQLMQGLKAFGILELMCSNPNKMRKLFISGDEVPLTMDMMLDNYFLIPIWVKSVGIRRGSGYDLGELFADD